MLNNKQVLQPNLSESGAQRTVTMTFSAETATVRRAAIVNLCKQEMQSDPYLRGSLLAILQLVRHGPRILLDQLSIIGPKLFHSFCLRRVRHVHKLPV